MKVSHEVSSDNSKAQFLPRYNESCSYQWIILTFCNFCVFSLIFLQDCKISAMQSMAFETKKNLSPQQTSRQDVASSTHCQSSSSITKASDYNAV